MSKRTNKRISLMLVLTIIFSLLTPFAEFTKAAGTYEPMLSAYSRSFAYVDELGDVYTWGENQYGQLGTGDKYPRRFPTKVKGLSNIVQIDITGTHTLALKADGTVWVMGSSTYGQLGLGDNTERLVPTQIPSLTNIKQIDAMNNSSYAIGNDNVGYSWGYNGYGQLGFGDKINRNTPTQITKLSNITKISADENMVVALTVDKFAYGWGYNTSGGLGVGDLVEKTSPTKVASLTDVVDVVTGGYTSYFTLSDNRVFGAGPADYLGLGTSSSTKYSTPAVITGLSGAIKIAPEVHGVALKTDKTILGWGANSDGRIGLGHKNSPVVPATAIPNVSNVKLIDAAYGDTVILTEDKKLYAWGIEHGTNTPMELVIMKDNTVSFEGGSGTVEDPYLIASAEQLYAINQDTTANYKLIANIDLNIAPFNQEYGWYPLDTFKGTLDGNGYTISNLQANYPITRAINNNVGLFSVLSGSTVKNLKFLNPNVVSGSDFVGVLTGTADNNTVIDNVIVENPTVKGKFSVGGLVGLTNYSEVKNSAVIGGTINSNIADPYLMKTGGIIGEFKYSTLTDSFATVKVTGNQFVGGLIGQTLYGEVSNSYYEGDIEVVHPTSYYNPPTSIGGLVGANSASIESSYSKGNIIYQGANTATNFGGLIGNVTVSNGKINNSFSHVNMFIGNGDKIGGLVGSLNAPITNSYSIGTMSGTSGLGGLVGYRGSSGSATFAYWDTESSGMTTSSTGIGKTNLQMKTTSTFNGWDTTIWKIQDGAYPTLRALEVTPLANVSNFASSNVTHNSATLKWDAVQNATQYVVKRDGVIVYQGNATQFTDSGLSSEVTYEYSIIAKNTKTESSPSALSVTTTVKAITSPTEFTSSDITSSSVKLTWTAVDGANEYILKRNGAVIYSGTNLSFIDSNLNANTKYTYSITSKDATMESPSKSLEVQTQGNPPKDVSNFKMDNVSPHTAALSWTKQDDATSYEIYRNDDVLVYEGNLTVFRDTMLNAEQEYKYSIKAVNEFGKSNNFMNVVFTTPPDTGSTNITQEPVVTPYTVTFNFTVVEGVHTYQINRNPQWTYTNNGDGTYDVSYYNSVTGLTMDMGTVQEENGTLPFIEEFYNGETGNMKYDIVGYKAPASDGSQVITDPQEITVSVPEPSATPSTNADLSSLVDTLGLIDGKFNADTTSYEIQVPAGTSSIKFKSNTVDSNSIITVNGVPVAHGGWSQVIDLSTLPQLITIKVTAEDQNTVKEYKILITEEGASQEYTDGYTDGYEQGKQDGQQDGYEDGYNAGQENGKQDGYTDGYQDGKQDGQNEGYQDGKQDGYNEGLKDGQESGKKDGYEDGRKDGYNDGLKSGYEQGRKDGYNDGVKSGYEQGSKDGYNDGVKNGYEQGLKDGKNSPNNSCDKETVVSTPQQPNNSNATQSLENSTQNPVSNGLSITLVYKTTDGKILEQSTLSLTSGTNDLEPKELEGYVFVDTKITNEIDNNSIKQTITFIYDVAPDKQETEQKNDKAVRTEDNRNNNNNSKKIKESSFEKHKDKFIFGGFGTVLVWLIALTLMQLRNRSRK